MKQKTHDERPTSCTVHREARNCVTSTRNVTAIVASHLQLTKYATCLARKLRGLHTLRFACHLRLCVIILLLGPNNYSAPVEYSGKPFGAFLGCCYAKRFMSLIGPQPSRRYCAIPIRIPTARNTLQWRTLASWPVPPLFGPNAVPLELIANPFKLLKLKWERERETHLYNSPGRRTAFRPRLLFNRDFVAILRSNIAIRKEASINKFLCNNY